MGDLTDRMNDKMDHDLAHYTGYGTTTPLQRRVHPAPPSFESEKGVQFFAKDSDGQWYYANHANQWCACPPPWAELSK